MNKITVLAHNHTGKSLTVVYVADGKTATKLVDESHVNWKQVNALYKQQKYEALVPLLDVSQAITKKFNGKFVVKNGKVFYNDEVVAGFLFDRIISFMQNGLPYERLIKFAENLWKNPSSVARAELFKFLDAKGGQNGRVGGFPLTDDGCFLAYKGVQDDYYSITGGTIKVIKGKVKNGKIYNGVGEEIEVDRVGVDSNCNNTCSTGLHAGSWEYANGFKGTGRLMIVKVNPKDVVSIPTDSNCQKLRTCAYKVIAEDGRKLSETRDINYDRAAKVRQQHNSVGQKRDKTGRFA